MTRKPTTPVCSDPVLPNEWDTPHRASVKHMRKNGTPAKQIQEITGVSLRTQSRILKQSIRRPGKKRSGRTPKISHDTTDLNPIENVWRILKSRVKLRHSASPQELRKNIEEVWKEITLEEINECILGSKKHPNRHMHQRFQLCVDNNGLSTEN